MIELQEFLNSSYVELLKKAKEWLNSRQPNLSNLEKNKEKVEKLAIACLVKKTKRKEELKRQKIEESYILDIEKANVENLEKILKSKNTDNGILLWVNEGFEKQNYIDMISKEHEINLKIKSNRIK